MQPAEASPGSGHASKRIGRRDRATPLINAHTAARRSNKLLGRRLMIHYLYNYVAYVIADGSLEGNLSSILIDLSHQRLIIRQRRGSLSGETVEQCIRRGNRRPAIQPRGFDAEPRQDFMWAWECRDIGMYGGDDGGRVVGMRPLVRRCSPCPTRYVEANRRSPAGQDSTLVMSDESSEVINSLPAE